MQYPQLNVVETGENINRLRIESGYSVKQLQNIFGFSTPQAIYKWINGYSMPTIDNLVILASVLNVKVDDILVIDNKRREIA